MFLDILLHTESMWSLQDNLLSIIAPRNLTEETCVIKESLSLIHSKIIEINVFIAKNHKMCRSINNKFACRKPIGYIFQFIIKFIFQHLRIPM